MASTSTLPDLASSLYPEERREWCEWWWAYKEEMQLSVAPSTQPKRVWYAMRPAGRGRGSKGGKERGETRWGM